MVMVSEAQAAVTPAGRPVGVPIPVAPVVLRLIVAMGELAQLDMLDDTADTVFVVQSKS